MKWSPRVEQAIKKASILHRAQTRRGDVDYPYITHLVSVGAILGHYTSDEDVIIAGLLHDTIEDTDYTPEELEKDFGKRVRDIVMGVTEKKEENGERLSWEVRKSYYLKTLEEAPTESLLVSAADKIHNLRSIAESYQSMGKEFWQVYTRLRDPEKITAEREARLRYFGDVLAIVKRRGVSEGIVHEFEDVYKETLTTVNTE